MYIYLVFQHNDFSRDLDGYALSRAAFTAGGIASNLPPSLFSLFSDGSPPSMSYLCLFSTRKRIISELIEKNISKIGGNVYETACIDTINGIFVSLC
jgi:hypothetical protein